MHGGSAKRKGLLGFLATICALVALFVARVVLRRPAPPASPAHAEAGVPAEEWAPWNHELFLTHRVRGLRAGMAARPATRRRYLALGLALLVLVVWAFTLRPVSLGGPAGYVIVDGTSMEPTYWNHDLVITRRADHYRDGDVIAYHPSTDVYSGASLTIHRIIGVDANGAYLTQGDNRPTPDQWVATPEDTLGKAWIYIPHVGGWILRAREPRNLTVILAGFAGLSIFGGSGASRRRGRNGEGRNVNGKQIWGGAPLSGRSISLAVVLGVLALGSLVVGAMAFRSAPNETITRERPHHEHAVAFDYLVSMSPSTLYPNGIVGPVEAPEPPPFAAPVDSASPDGEVMPVSDVPPIYLKLAREMELGISYALRTELPAEISGRYSVALTIQAGADGWTRSEELIPPTAFSGTEAAFRVPLDLAALAAEIEKVEEETGFSPTEYVVSLVPSIEVTGTISGQPLEESVAPGFAMTLDSIQITPESPLSRIDPRPVSESFTVERDISLGGLAVPVASARVASVAGLLAALGGLAILAYLAAQRLRADESRMIQLRHGSMLVDVTGSEATDDYLERVRLTTMRDLVRIAQHDGQVIFHHDRGPQGRRYFVPDGTVVYEYTASAPARTARSVHSPGPLSGSPESSQ